MKSMTGYGRAKEDLNGRPITVELRAVNHRYLDCTVKAPRQYGFLDDAVKKAAASRIARGKVEIFVSVETQEGGDIAVTVNHTLAKRYLDALHMFFGIGKYTCIAADGMNVAGFDAEASLCRAMQEAAQLAASL